MAIERDFTELGQFDLATLLRISDKSWYAMHNVVFIPTRERECIRDMTRVRNNWAHVSAMLTGKDAILLIWIRYTISLNSVVVKIVC